MHGPFDGRNEGAADEGHLCAAMDWLLERQPVIEQDLASRQFREGLADGSPRTDLKFHQWTWIKRGLVRKGLIGGRRQSGKDKPTGFVPVRIAPAAAVAAATTTVCRIRHPSGWMIECASFPEASWMSALLSGEAA